MSEIKKLKGLKNDVIVPIEIHVNFYRLMNQLSVTILENTPDPKKTLENIEKAQNDTTQKLTISESTLYVLMSLIQSVESEANLDPEKYIEELERPKD